jgi:hypothetical protein
VAVEEDGWRAGRAGDFTVDRGTQGRDESRVPEAERKEGVGA